MEEWSLRWDDQEDLFERDGDNEKPATWDPGGAFQAKESSVRTLKEILTWGVKEE